MMTTSWRSRPVWAFLLALGFIVAAVAWSAPAAAQDPPCDPIYGCTPTSPLPGSILACPTLEPRQGPPGTQVTVTVTGVDPPDATVTILFDGSPIASGTASDGTAQITFTVPAAEPGHRTVTAVAPNGSANCGPSGGFTAVAAAGADRGRGGGGDDTSRGGSRGGSLARTGITIVGLLIAAAVLIMAGRALQEQSRHRRDATP